MTDRPLPFEGIRIVDFSRLLPGPWATRMLAEMGATVIKVEPPGEGDPSRHNHPAYRQDSVYSHQCNAGKRSICVDLASAYGQRIAQRLLREADVLVETYRPGVADKLGVGYRAARELNPRLIHCSISGFGHTGPMATVAGHDLIIQGMTGLMGCSLDAVNPPTVPGLQSADYAGALTAVIGIQAALAQRAKTGEGCQLDLSMYEALFSMCMIPLSTPLARRAGFGGEPRMESFGGNPRYCTYLSRDHKPIAVTLLETKAWRAFCELAGRLDLVFDDEAPADRLSTHGERGLLYRQALKDYCASYTWAEHMERMNRLGIAICPICTPEEALVQPQVAARNMLVEIDHPVEGRIPHLTNPLARSGLATAAPAPAPTLGADANAILRELAFTDAEIAAFRAAGTI